MHTRVTSTCGQLGEYSRDDDNGDEQVSNITNEVNRCPSKSNEWNGDEHEVWAATFYEVNHTNIQLLDSILESAEFIFTEHCFLVHLTPDASSIDVNTSSGVGKLSDIGGVSCDSNKIQDAQPNVIHDHEQERNDDMTYKHMSHESIINGRAINGSISFKRAVTTAMEQFATCRHEAADDLSWPCLECECDFYKAMVEIQSQNVIPSRFVGELSRCEHENTELLRPACLGFANALSASLDVSQQYTDNL